MKCGTFLMLYIIALKWTWILFQPQGFSISIFTLLFLDRFLCIFPQSTSQNADFVCWCIVLRAEWLCMWLEQHLDAMGQDSRQCRGIQHPTLRVINRLTHTRGNSCAQTPQIKTEWYYAWDLKLRNNYVRQQEKIIKSQNNFLMPATPLPPHCNI